MSNQPLWSAAEAVDATGGRSTADWTASGVSIDSRSLRPGDLFIALKGPSFDGHNFIGAAIQAGAAAVMAHRVPEGALAGAPMLLVDDTMDALRALGAAARARSAARFIGVTGSVGKTGTKEALRACLAAQAPTTASLGSLNNHWGVPLSLARMPRDDAYGVFEMGMNHPGEIRDLTGLVRPDVAVITTVEAAHIEHFASVAEIAEAKAEIFEGMGAAGTAVLNRDNPRYGRLAARARAAGVGRIIGFGRHPEAEARLSACSLHDDASAVSAVVLGQAVRYRLSLPGAHWVMNSLAVLAAAAAVGADLGRAAEELARLRPLKGRGERHEVRLANGSFILIDDSYNANPTSMKAAFAVLARTALGPGGRRVVALGDMLELGKDAETLHARLAPAIEAAGIELVFTCGKDMAALHEALPERLRGGHLADSRALAALVDASVQPGDAILVKGSAGSRMGLVVDALKARALPLPRAVNGE